MDQQKEGVCYARGFTAGAGRAGIKESSPKDDTAVIYSSIPCNAAAVYTTNKVQAAPLKINQEHLKDGRAQCIVINSGNANAAARNGLENARKVAEKAAEVFDVPVEDVLVGSTGVIGKELPVDKITALLPGLTLDEYSSQAANLAIMTTDTRTKSVCTSFLLDDKECRIGGICKGSGMIHPNMGTMLCYITTDTAITSQMLQKALQADVQKTFNRVTVDGDTSTNDMVIVLANGLAGNAEITAEDDSFYKFTHALKTIMQALAIEIARDGEGASRLLSVNVSGTRTEQEAEKIARSVAGSTLLKAAMFGKDANWGRVICAMGYSGEDFDPQHTDISFASVKGDLLVCEGGQEVDFDEEKATEILSEDMVDINIDIHQGDQEATCWGCDLTYDYVRINGDYRT